MLKKYSVSIILITLIGLFCVFNTYAVEKELVDPDIPDSWYETPKTASEINITEFNQSPILDERVQNGELPPVQDRLPNDPPTIEPYDEIGEYGGTVIAWDRTLYYYEMFFWNYYGGARTSPDGMDAIPSYMEGWEFSNNHKDITLFLREGLKWSDGHPFTADDYMYWWDHVANNEVLTPTPPDQWNPPLLDVTKENDMTVTFHYGRAVPHSPFSLRWFSMSPDGTIAPAHFMKKIHPDFAGEEKVDKLAEEVGLSWDEYYQRIQDDSPHHPEYKYQRPVLSTYVVTERTETSLIAERNPYYPFVDIEGNQLPYIDKIRINLANSPEMASSKAATGEATFAARHPQTTDIPLYKRNEEKSDFKTFLYNITYGGISNIKLNLTHKDLKLRSIFQDLKFRKALSYAIDREQINNKVYFGRGVPSQATIPPANESYKEKYANAYAEHNSDLAKELLDDLGMIDRDGDGYREMPIGKLETMNGKEITLEGEKFNPTMIYCKMGAIEPTPILELVRQDFKEIGINIKLKEISRELFNQRVGANDGDIYPWTGNSQVPFGADLYTLLEYAPFSAPWLSAFPSWTNWYRTNGEEGEEPPQLMKELIDYCETVLYSPDKKERMEAKTKLLEAQAENLWEIGTVSLIPQPIIVSNQLQNVPETGIWNAKSMYMYPYHTEQFYIKK